MCIITGIASSKINLIKIYVLDDSKNKKYYNALATSEKFTLVRNLSNANKIL